MTQLDKIESMLTELIVISRCKRAIYNPLNHEDNTEREIEILNSIRSHGTDVMPHGTGVGISFKL